MVLNTVLAMFFVPTEYSPPSLTELYNSLLASRSLSTSYCLYLGNKSATPCISIAVFKKASSRDFLFLFKSFISFASVAKANAESILDKSTVMSLRRDAL